MTTHYIISVQDSINDYREVQGGHVDARTKDDAAEYFRNTAPWCKYFGDLRYQIVMTANSDILQWPE